MNIDAYVKQIRDGVEAAVSLADSETKDVASRVVSSLEPSVRLALIEAIADAASEVDERLTTAHVTMTLQQGNPSFVVEERGITVEQLASYAGDGDDETEIIDELDEDLEDEWADDELVRFSLRIPRWAKDKIDQRAERDGVSTNAYLSELIVGHVARRRGRRDFGPGGPGNQGGGRPGGAGGHGRPGFGQGPGFGPFGPGFLNPDVIGEIGRMFADTFGEGESGERGPWRGGQGPGGRGYGGRGQGRRGPGGRGPAGQAGDGDSASGDQSSDDGAETTD